MKPIPLVRNTLGEGPLWCARTQRLWWIDVTAPAICRWSAKEGARTWALPRPIGAIALLRDGGILLVFRTRLAIASEEAPDELHYLLPRGLELGDERFNDGKVDAAGRLWIGTLDRQLQRPIGALRRFDERLVPTVVDSGFALSNGIGWSPENDVMYFADTHSRSIHRYRFDAAQGVPAQRTLLAQVEPGPGGPDGLTVDAEGFIWCAMFERGELRRFAPDGRVDRVIPLPVSRPTSCTFGGPDLSTLFVTTARHGLDARQLHNEPLAGFVLEMEVGVKGYEQPRFAATHAQLSALALEAA